MIEHDTATRSAVLKARGIDPPPAETEISANGAPTRGPGAPCEICGDPLPGDAQHRATTHRGECRAERDRRQARARYAVRAKEAPDAAPPPPPPGPDQAPHREVERPSGEPPEGREPTPVEVIAGDLAAAAAARARELLGLEP